ncbi:MAG: hypothetical protein CSA76_04860 [Spirochaetales bacterium]|nr:MAG: hypothetical protein CSA76_04860 [Spirochaetales bacterium]
MQSKIILSNAAAIENSSVPQGLCPEEHCEQAESPQRGASAEGRGDGAREPKHKSRARTYSGKRGPSAVRQKVPPFQKKGPLPGASPKEGPF